jgi:hypothetical protein
MGYLERRKLHSRLILLVDYLENLRQTTGKAVKVDCDCGCGKLHARAVRRAVHVYGYLPPGAPKGPGKTRLFDLYFFNIKHCNRAMSRWGLPLLPEDCSQDSSMLPSVSKGKKSANKPGGGSNGGGTPTGL